MSSGGRHLWKGQWIDDAALEQRLAGLGEALNRDFPAALGMGSLLDACERLGARLRGDGPLRRELLESLAERLPAQDAKDTVEELAAFLGRAELEEKLARELGGGGSGRGSPEPGRLERVDFRRDVFEAWAPLGFLVHIAPTNAANVPFLSVLEGLLAGNVCLVKLGGSELDYPLLCLRALADCDAGGRLAEFVYAARIPSRRQDLMKLCVQHADGVAVWGGEEAIAGVRALAPPHARVIEWGPKISFAYVARDRLEASDAELDGIARECCLMEQQACSSPQAVYVETSEPSVLSGFAARLARALERVSPTIPRAEPGPAERAELTKVVEIARLEGCLPGDPARATQVLEGGDWRVLVEWKEGLRASPLYRTVWVKPLPRASILKFLRPLRHYLQTVGLCAGLGSLGELSSLFFRAGALRLMPVGRMTAGYMGEPHDGVYALARYSRRVSALAPQAAGLTAIEVARPAARPGAASGPVTGKAEFGAQRIDDRDAELFFKSGGSSGEPKLSVFTYHDYHAQMRAAAHGVYAAGLDPKTDRCMNLFFSGGLYGGFLSFFTILEELEAVQFPMTAHADLDFVGRMIVERKVDTLLGMPSYLAGLFRANHERFKAYRGVRKIFFGGEHLSEAQRAHLRGEYGVELIRSAAYGSNDIGPMGYQCPHCQGSVHHLHEDLQVLEILELGELGDAGHDRPAAPGAAGRLVFSPRVRRGQSLARYDLGDLGRWVEGACPCGRAAARFELLGRQGDIFRCGGTFLNYQRLAAILAEIPGFGAGELQVTLSRSAAPGLTHDVLSLCYAGTGVDPALVRARCLDGYKDLHEVVAEDGVVELDVRAVAAAALERVAASGKLRHVIDRRLGPQGP